MVVIISKEGQLANRIWHCSSFIANAKENNYKVYHLYFEDFEYLFSESFQLNKKDNPVTFIKNKWIKKIIVKTYYYLQRLKISNSFIFSDIEYYESLSTPNAYNLNTREFIRKAKNKIVFIKGWTYKDDIGFLKHSTLIKNIFTPNTVYSENAFAVMARARVNYEVIVAIHMRKKDYKEFNNGVWYYDNATYLEKMNMFIQLPEIKNKKVCFLICSNEIIDQSDFPGLTLIADERPFIEDSILLSQADYIMGPPSTFSMWASFYGSVPLCMISSRDQVIDMKHFKIIEKQ